MFFLKTKSSQAMHRSGAGSEQQPAVAMMIESVGLGGAEMVVAQLAEALRARGHRVEPIVPDGREGWLVDELEANGFNCHRYDLRRAVDLGFSGRLANQLKALQVDVVHSHEFVMAVYGTAAAERIGVPHIITMHGNQGMTDRFRRRAALRWAFRRSQATIAVSNDTRRHLESSLGLRPGVVDVIPNGIPERAGDRAALRAALSVSDHEVLLLSVGSLTPRKAHVVLLEALALLEQRGEGLPWRLAIVGEGPERPLIEQKIQETGFDQRVHLLGKRTDIPDLQAAADIFVLPSLWEGLPLAILEGMFGGNPIIASNISGIPEAVEHGTHGLLTPPGDAPALADAIGALVRDPVARNQMANAAQQSARSRFTIDAMASAYARLYF
jgi:glycosyltransferase involved in cell wall biosynthesis